ncbi:MAG: DUF559 domain-containing protein, partial [Solirubrobacteraceae bacterium]
VVAPLQLEGLGYSRHAIQRRVDQGRLHRLHRGVYAVGHTKLPPRGRWMAAVLACGDGACLSHASAAALHDLRRVPGGLLDVTAPSRHRLAGIRSHFVRQSLRTEVVVIDQIPVTSIERTVLDEAARLAAPRMLALLEQAQRLGKLDAGRLDTAMAESHGHRGIPRLRAALAEVRDDAPWLQSGNERLFLDLVRAAGIPEPSANVLVEGLLVDFLWPQERLVVEIDSYRYHQSRRAFEADRERDRRLMRAGYRVLRYTDRWLEAHPGDVIAELKAVLAALAA